MDGGSYPAPGNSPTGASYGEALAWLKQGHRVRRQGWNGKGMWLAYVAGNDWGFCIHQHPRDMDEDMKIIHPNLPFIIMRTVSAQCVPWLCSQTDAFATDWEKIS